MHSNDRTSKDVTSWLTNSCAKKKGCSKRQRCISSSFELLLDDSSDRHDSPAVQAQGKPLFLIPCTPGASHVLSESSARDGTAYSEGPMLSCGSDGSSPPTVVIMHVSRDRGIESLSAAHSPPGAPMLLTVDDLHIPPSAVPANRMFFASEDYFIAVWKRQLVQMLQRAAALPAYLAAGGTSTSATMERCSVRSLRRQYPALELVHASVIEDRVLRPLLRNKLWFTRGDDGEVVVLPGAYGVPVAVGNGFFPGGLLQRLLLCDGRILDASLVSIGPDGMEQYSWPALSCLEPLRQLLRFPVGALRHVVTLSMNNTLVEEILNVAQFLDAIRPQTSRRSGDRFDDDVSSLKWEAVLRAYLPRFLRNMRHVSSSAAENLCVFVGASCGIVQPAIGTQRTMQYAKSALQELFSGSKENSSLPPFGPFVVARPLSASSSTKAHDHGDNGVENDDELVADLFDNEEPDKSEISAANSVHHDAATSVLLHNVVTNEVSVCKGDEMTSWLSSNSLETPCWERVPSIIGASPCPYCQSATHEHLYQCPWFLATAMRLHRQSSNPSFLRVDMQRKEDANTLSLSGIDASVIKSLIPHESSEKKAMEATHTFAISRRDMRRRRGVWMNIADKFGEENGKKWRMKFTARVTERTQNPEEILSVHDGIDLMVNCLCEIHSEKSKDEWKKELTAFIAQSTFQKELDSLFPSSSL